MYRGGKFNRSIRPRGDYSEFLKGGAGCPYKVLFPGNAGKYDQIALKVKKLDNMDLIAIDTVSFTAQKFKEIVLNEGDTYIIEFPNMLFLALNSNSEESSGYYDLAYRYINRDPKTVEKGALELSTIEALEALGTKARNEQLIGISYYAMLYCIGGLLLLVIILIGLLVYCK
jgi:hypothetical protein